MELTEEKNAFGDTILVVDFGLIRHRPLQIREQIAGTRMTMHHTENTTLQVRAILARELSIEQVRMALRRMVEHLDKKVAEVAE